MNDAVPAETPGRAYRSKKHRPCDLCRSRKIQCKIQTNQTTCELCSRLDRRCTYLVGPLRRKPRAGGGADRRVVASSQRQRRRQHQQQPQVGVDRYVDQDVADTIHVDVWAGPDTENFTLGA